MKRSMNGGNAHVAAPVRLVLAAVFIECLELLALNHDFMILLFAIEGQGSPRGFTKSG